MIDRNVLAKKATMLVECGECSWDNGGKLFMVDRYAADHPPIPKREIIEVYRDYACDPDDRLHECPECGAELDADECRPQSGWAGERPDPNCDECGGEGTVERTYHGDPQTGHDVPCPTCIVPFMPEPDYEGMIDR